MADQPSLVPLTEDPFLGGVETLSTPPEQTPAEPKVAPNPKTPPGLIPLSKNPFSDSGPEGATPTPEPTWVQTILGSAASGLATHLEKAKQAEQTVGYESGLTQELPESTTAPTTLGGKLAQEPFEFGTMPTLRTAKKIAAQLIYGSAATAPELVGSMIGGGAASEAGPLGVAAGAAVGAAIPYVVENLAPDFVDELHKSPHDPDAAFDRAIKKTALGTAESAVGFGSFAITPFKGAVKNLLFQSLGVQPAVAAASQAAENALAGRPTTEGATQAALTAAATMGPMSAITHAFHALTEVPKPEPAPTAEGAVAPEEPSRPIPLKGGMTGRVLTPEEIASAQVGRVEAARTAASEAAFQNVPAYIRRAGAPNLASAVGPLVPVMDGRGGFHVVDRDGDTGARVFSDSLVSATDTEALANQLMAQRSALPPTAPGEVAGRLEITVPGAKPTPTETVAAVAPEEPSRPIPLKGGMTGRVLTPEEIASAQVGRVEAARTAASEAAFQNVPAYIRRAGAPNLASEPMISPNFPVIYDQAGNRVLPTDLMVGREEMEPITQALTPAENLQQKLTGLVNQLQTIDVLRADPRTAVSLTDAQLTTLDMARANTAEQMRQIQEKLEPPVEKATEGRPTTGISTGEAPEESPLHAAAPTPVGEASAIIPTEELPPHETASAVPEEPPVHVKLQPSQEAPEAATEAAPIEHTLPKTLSTIAPRYGSRVPKFASNVDRALYTVQDRTKLSAADSKIVDFLKNTVGYTDSEITKHAQTVKDAVKAQAKAVGKDADIQIPRTAPEAGARTPTTPPAERERPPAVNPDLVDRVEKLQLETLAKQTRAAADAAEARGDRRGAEAQRLVATQAENRLAEMERIRKGGDRPAGDILDDQIKFERGEKGISFQHPLTENERNKLFDGLHELDSRKKDLLQNTEDRGAVERALPTGDTSGLSHRDAAAAAEIRHIDGTIGVHERALQERGVLEPVTKKLSAVHLTPEEATKIEPLIMEAREILSRIAPQARAEIYKQLHYDGTEKGRPLGATISDGERAFIALAAESPHLGETTRHEALHWLREMGFFSPNEWAALRSEALTKNWIKNHNIVDRYEKLVGRPEAQLEEAIAHEYQTRAAQEGARWSGLPAIVQKVFQKIDLALRRIRAAAKELFGRKLSAQDVYGRIESGEIGRREVYPRGPPLESGVSIAFENMDPAQKANAVADGVKRADNVVDRVYDAIGHKILTHTSDKIKEAYLSVLHPDAGRRERRLAGSLFAEFKTRLADAQNAISQILERHEVMFARMNEADRLKYNHDYETGRLAASGDPVAKELNQMTDAQAELERQHGVLRADYRENYLPHRFKDPEGVKKYFDDQRRQYGKYFDKARDFDTMKQAMAAGFEIKDTNAATMVKERIKAGMEAVEQKRVLEELKKRGYADTVSSMQKLEKAREELANMKKTVSAIEGRENPTEDFRVSPNDLFDERKANRKEIRFAKKLMEYGVTADELKRGVTPKEMSDLVERLRTASSAELPKPSPLGKETYNFRGPDSEIWHLNTDAARLWKNAIAEKGLWGDPGLKGTLFRSWMQAKRIWMVPTMLGFYHPSHLLGVDPAAHMAAYLDHAMSSGGSWREGLGDVFKSLSLQHMRYVTEGNVHKYQKAWNTPDVKRTDEQKEYVRLMTLGGFNPTMSEMERAHGKVALAKAINSQGVKRVLAVAGHGTEALANKMTGWMFDRLIPSMKCAVYEHRVNDLIKRDLTILHPENEDNLRLALSDIRKDVHLTHGEMDYGTMFASKNLVQLAQAAMISVGWNLSQIKYFQGLAKAPFGVAASFLGLKRSKYLDYSALYALSYTMAGLLSGATVDRMFTGDWSDNPMDWVFPRLSSVKNPDGTYRRGTLPYFFKDAFMLRHKYYEQGNLPAAAITMMADKTFAPSIYRTMIEGKNYFGERQIGDITDWREWAALAERTFEPFAVGAEPGLEKAGVNKYWAVAGLVPAPGYITQTPAEQKILHEYNAITPPKWTAYTHDLQKDLIEARRNGDADEQVRITSLLEQKGVPPSAYVHAGQSTYGGKTFTGFAFSRLPADAQIALLRDFSDEEYRQWYVKADEKARMAMRQIRGIPTYKPPE